jgi:cytosine/creatinine deaminase
MTTGFAVLPDGTTYRLVNAHAPLCLVDGSGLGADQDGLTKIDLVIDNGRIASVLPSGTSALADDLPIIDLKGGIVFPRLVDVHTHLDKGHIWPRRRNPDGSFFGALSNVMIDREANWSAKDVAARMDFSLRAAFAHGTGAIRTHLDSLSPQLDISWPVFAEMRETWKDRITLQAAAIFRIDLAVDDPAAFDHLVKTVAKTGGVLGGVTYLGQPLDDKIRVSIRRAFEAADSHGLDLDFHVDESDSPDACSLEIIADMALEMRFIGKVLAGHCCSLALMDGTDMARVIGKLAEANIAVVSLPMCNMYLQDRVAGRTPRWRGVVPIHELKAAGVTVMVASDNTRDPFYAYGDLDLVEVMREATRILHFDHSGPDWFNTVARTPADLMGLDRHGRIAAGGPADLILTRARSLTELFSRPQSDRTVLVKGRAIDTTLPDYAELDPLMSV